MPKRTRAALTIATALLTSALLAPVALGASATRPSHSTAPATSSATHPDATKGGSDFPVTVSSPYGKVTIPTRPTRIISLSPTATEMLYAIDARTQVIAVDDDSDYPRNIPRTTLSGYTPNIEAIAAYRPDLVVISYNPSPPNVVSSLKLLGIPVLYLPAAANLAQTYTEIDKLGVVTGERVHSDRLVHTMKSSIATLERRVRRHSPAPTYFYELDPTLYTATSDSFIGSVLSLAGLHNIAGASVHGDDYPQLSSEAVVHANPTFIFLADGASVASVDARPGWSALSAVRDHRVIELNEDIASRWGPRIVELLADVVAAEDTLPSSSGS